ncbi:MAG: hypothetical protein ACJAR3_002472, partial [Roseivirga sp.]
MIRNKATARLTTSLMIIFMMIGVSVFANDNERIL